MTIERAIRLLAGTVVLTSVALGAPGSPLHHDPRWLWVTAFAGANLLQSAITGFCLPAIVLARLGVPATAPVRVRTHDRAR